MGFGLWLGDLRGRRRGEEVSLAISRRHTIIPTRKRRLNIIRRIYDIASLQTLQHIPPQAPRHRDIDPWHIWDFSLFGRAKLLLFLAVALNPRLLYRLRSRGRNWIVEIESLGGWSSHVSRVSLGSRGLSIYKRILALRKDRFVPYIQLLVYRDSGEAKVIVVVCNISSLPSPNGDVMLQC